MTEQDARDCLAGDRAQALTEVILGAFDTYVADGYPRRRSARASVVHDNMVRAADARFATLAGVRRTETRGIPVYVVDEFLAVRLKMHDAEHNTHNHESGHQLRLMQQGLLDGLPDVLAVTTGYELDLTETSVVNLPVVRRVDGVIEWEFDLRDVAGGAAGQATTVTLPYMPKHPTLPTIRRAGDEDITGSSGEPG